MALSRRHSLQSGTADGEGNYASSPSRRSRITFLTVHDIVKYAKAQGILCQGRGSAANSAICYVLGVTAWIPTHSTCCSSVSSAPNARAARTSTWISSMSGWKESPSISTGAMAAAVPLDRHRDLLSLAQRHSGSRQGVGLTEDVIGKLADTVWGHSWRRIGSAAGAAG